MRRLGRVTHSRFVEVLIWGTNLNLRWWIIADWFQLWLVQHTIRPSRGQLPVFNFLKVMWTYVFCVNITKRLTLIMKLYLSISIIPIGYSLLFFKNFVHPCDHPYSYSDEKSIIKLCTYNRNSDSHYYILWIKFQWSASVDSVRMACVIC